MAEENPQPSRVAIVGAGLVGALTAIYLAQRSWDVSLFDLRPDMRIPENKARNQGRSINLALSTRGISALQGTGLNLHEEILKAAVPMKGRMIHLGKEGKLQSQAYGVRGEYINAVDRAKLNEDLLDAAERFQNVKIYFEHLFKTADLDKGTLEFETRDGELVTFESDLIIGADGAYSAVRNQLMRKVRMDYHQEYIDTAYCELTIPPRIGTDGELEYAMDPNHLHIWPRKTFMLIALPNPDRTFTCTLFMPWSTFMSINLEEELLEFFEEYFNDAIPLIGEQRLKEEYFRNPRGPLLSIKCTPYHYKDRTLIIGDAAHAMVPFYGQGMNCGFEDVQVLADILDKHRNTAVRSPQHREDSKGLHQPSDLEIALNNYSELRHTDVVAMCDLAMYNHYEMRAAVTSRAYLARKYLEAKLHLLFPAHVIPLYTMISFSRIRYSEAVKRWRAQTWWFNVLGWSAAAGTMLAGLALGMRHGKEMKQAMVHAARTIGDVYVRGS